MTSPDSSPHLSLDALADLLAGEGSDADLSHVGACTGCAGRLDELATAEVEVAAVLAALPAPAMPADLADRLSAALAAEPALEPAPASEGPVALGDGARAAASASAPARSATVTPFPDARRRRSWLPAAAAVALLLSGGALGTSLLLSDGSGSDDAATSAAGAPEGGASGDDFSGLTRNETGTDYAADGTLDAALPGLLSGSAEPLTAPLSVSGTDEPASELAPASSPRAESQADEVAPAPSGTDGSFSALGPGDPALDRLRTPEGLASCLAAVLPPDDTSVRPLAVDYAAYQGQPALVVLLPASGAADKVDVFVVGAGCTVGDDQTLFFTRLDRPA